MEKMMRTKAGRLVWRKIIIRKCMQEPSVPEPALVPAPLAPAPLVPAPLALVPEPAPLARTEVQGHGFSWEKEILTNIFKVPAADLKTINYTSKMDLPASFNPLDQCDVSIKTSGKANAVCMADCLRVFDAVSTSNPFHLIVIHYKQQGAKKKVSTITEVDLTNSRALLFGSLERTQLLELDKAVKAVPQNRSPTIPERTTLYAIRDALQPLSGALHLDIKCNSTQSRLQCSFNKFQAFIAKNPALIVAKSLTHEFRGGMISAELTSLRRVFKDK
jgi:hypothetical protein